MDKPYGAVRLRNDIRKIDPNLVVEVKNVRVNQALMGAYGFVLDPSTGNIVCVSTDRNHGPKRDAMYRNARNVKDHTGLRNRFAPEEELAAAIVRLLRSDDRS